MIRPDVIAYNWRFNLERVSSPPRLADIEMDVPPRILDLQLDILCMDPLEALMLDPIDTLLYDIMIIGFLGALTCLLGEDPMDPTVAVQITDNQYYWSYDVSSEYIDLRKMNIMGPKTAPGYEHYLGKKIRNYRYDTYHQGMYKDLWEIFGQDKNTMNIITRTPQDFHTAHRYRYDIKAARDIAEQNGTNFDIKEQLILKFKEFFKWNKEDYSINSVDIYQDQTEIKNWYKSWNIVPIPSLQLNQKCEEYFNHTAFSGLPEHMFLQFNSYLEPDDKLLKSNIEKGLKDISSLKTDNPLILPIGTPIEFKFTAKDNEDVHSWIVPELGIKLNSIKPVKVIIEKEGTYTGFNISCGEKHGFIPIEIKAIPADEFKIFYLNNMGRSTYFDRAITFFIDWWEIEAILGGNSLPMFYYIIPIIESYFYAPYSETLENDIYNSILDVLKVKYRALFMYDIDSPEAKEIMVKVEKEARIISRTFSEFIKDPTKMGDQARDHYKYLGKDYQHISFWILDELQYNQAFLDHYFPIRYNSVEPRDFFK